MGCRCCYAGFLKSKTRGFAEEILLKVLLNVMEIDLGLSHRRESLFGDHGGSVSASRQIWCCAFSVSIPPCLPDIAQAGLWIFKHLALVIPNPKSTGFNSRYQITEICLLANTQPPRSPNRRYCQRDNVRSSFTFSSPPLELSSGNSAFCISFPVYAMTNYLYIFYKAILRKIDNICN